MSDQDLTISTPASITQCQNTTIIWSGGVGESLLLGMKDMDLGTEWR